jgi:2-polyprenyl-3-methyl-5-hydroxy-6-metoxy-1,4-benzoquinol methylase
MSFTPKIYVAKPSNLFTAGTEHYENAVRIVLEEDYTVAVNEELKSFAGFAASWFDSDGDHNPMDCLNAFREAQKEGRA